MVERSQKEVWRLTPWLMIALLLGNFILMAWDARESQSNQRMVRVWAQTLADFVQSPVTTLSSGVSGYFERISNLRTAQGENDTLKQKIQELEVELQGKQDLVNENERLRGLLQLKQESKYQILPSRIIGRDSSSWFNAAFINRGSADGVKLYMPVVTNGGLIGRITAVSPLISQVTMITDERSGVGAVIGEIGTSSALGVVNGVKDKGVLEMRYVPGSIEVKEGDFVYTTGQDGIYPAGLKLGEIVEVRSGSATVPHTIFIRPTAGISSMQEVAVLLYEAPPRPKFEQTVPNAVKDEKDKKKPAQ
jgi:rod shape-determining protein MreC